MITVQFEYAKVHDYEKMFFQPLFFLSMNIKQRILKEDAKLYNEKMLYTDLTFANLNNIKLEIAPSCLNENDFNVNYILNRYETEQQFSYKGANFLINTSKMNQYSFKNGHEEHTVTSSYEITYEAKDFILFEEFLKKSVVYFKEFSNAHKDDNNKLKMFISSDDGSYFESIGSRQKRNLESVFLPKEAKKNIIKKIEDFLKSETIERYKRFGVNHKLTIMLEGVPGTGKSSIITALASHFNFNIALISFTPKMTDVNFMRAMRTWERNNDTHKERETLLVIEDIDCIFKERKSNDESRNMVTFSGILNALDGITTCQNQIVIISTNHIENLDPALIRPGRVDHIMHFDYATKEQIKEMFTVYTKEAVDVTIINTSISTSISTITESSISTSTKTVSKVTDKADEFYNAVKNLNIKVTTSLLQQYLLKYADQVELILENVDEMKVIYDACNKHKAVDEIKMYS
jgi:AAA+ superfamily predicted ATPase